MKMVTDLRFTTEWVIEFDFLFAERDNKGICNFNLETLILHFEYSLYIMFLTTTLINIIIEKGQMFSNSYEFLNFWTSKLFFRLYCGME